MGHVEITHEDTLDDLKTQVCVHVRALNQVSYVKFASISIWCLPSNDVSHLLNVLYVYVYVHQVLTLPALQSVCVPTPAFLRVWQLEGQKLARILRGKQLTLRYTLWPVCPSVCVSVC